AAEIEGSARASIMLARTWRKKIGSVPNTRAVTGSVKCAATSLTFAKVPRSANCVDAMPPAANALVRIAKIKSAKANSRSGTVNSTADPATVTAALLAWLISIPLGTYAAERRNRWGDRVTVAGSAVLLTVPDLLLALALLIFAIRTNAFAAGGMASTQFADLGTFAKVKDVAAHFTLP